MAVSRKIDITCCDYDEKIIGKFVILLIIGVYERVADSNWASRAKYFLFDAAS